MRIIFLGTPEFAVASLEKLIYADHVPVVVVTAPDRKRGRGQKMSPTPVKVIAEEHGIPVLQPESVRDPSFIADIRALEPDVLVVVAFRILPPEVFEAARLGTFNLHASLLPAFRGAAPINRAIMDGATKTGVTTFFLQKKVDTGNIILAKSVEIGPDETAGELHDRLMDLGADAVLETVERIDAGQVETTKQDDSLATKAPKIFKEDALIDWTRPASDVHNHIRGLSPYPGAWTRHGDLILKIFKTRRCDGNGNSGEVLVANGTLVVACGESAVEIFEVQQQGKKRLASDDFLRGYSLERGTVFQ